MLFIDQEVHPNNLPWLCQLQTKACCKHMTHRYILYLQFQLHLHAFLLILIEHGHLSVSPIILHQFNHLLLNWTYISYLLGLQMSSTVGCHWRQIWIHLVLTTECKHHYIMLSSNLTWLETNTCKGPTSTKKPIFFFSNVRLCHLFSWHITLLTVVTIPSSTSPLKGLNKIAW